MSALNTHTPWAQAAATLTQRGMSFVVVTVLSNRGSTPRNPGTKMVISSDERFGTIGGGHLEHRTAAIAAQMINAPQARQHIEYFPLGPSLGQCCGGSTCILFEAFPARAFNVVLFGAGHVGQALAGILTQLPATLHWIDAREDVVEGNALGNSACQVSERPEEEVARMPSGSDYLIMTHNHQLDFAILEAVLKRRDARSIGLIGSLTKWRRFQLRLAHRGHSESDYASVRCPVGMPEVRGKEPMEIAVSIAAELLVMHHSEAPPQDEAPGIAQSSLKALMDDLTRSGADND